MKNKIWVGIIVLNLLLVVTLPFHYVSYDSNFRIYPKSQLSFRYTFITTTDVVDLIKQINDAEYLDKNAMYNDPVIRMLKERGIIVNKKAEDNKN